MTFYVSNDCCTLKKMSIFYSRATSKMWLTRYGSNHTLQSLINTWFVYTYMHNFKYTSYMYVITCQTTTLLYWTLFFCALELHERSDWRDTVYCPKLASWSLSDATLCVYSKPVIHHYLVCTYAWQTNSRTLSLYYTPKQCLYCQWYILLLRVKNFL